MLSQVNVFIIIWLGGYYLSLNHIINMKNLKTNVEKQNFDFEELCKRFDAYIKDPRSSNLTPEELERFSKELDRKMLEISIQRVSECILNWRFSTRSTKKYIRLMARHKWIVVRRTKRRRFNWNRELVTPEEIDAFKTILDMEWIDVSNDVFEELFE